VSISDIIQLVRAAETGIVYSQISDINDIDEPRFAECQLGCGLVGFSLVRKPGTSLIYLMQSVNAF